MPVTWEGDLFNALLDVEIELGDGVAGIGVSSSSGAFEYTNVALSGMERGKFHTDQLVVFPYVNSRLNERTEVWAFVGLGGGKVTASNPRLEADTDIQLVGLGLSSELGDLAGGRLRLKGALGGNSVETTALRLPDLTTASLPDLSTDSSHMELGLEYTPSRGGVLDYSGYLGLRRDSGDAGKGFGYEVGARLDRLSLGGLVDLDGGVRHIRRAGGFSEWGVDGRLSYRGERDGLGLAWHVRQRHGLELDGGTASRAVAGLRPLTDDPAVRGRRLDAEVSYGQALGGGVLKPSFHYEREDSGRSTVMGSATCAAGCCVGSWGCAITRSRASTS